MDLGSVRFILYILASALKALSRIRKIRRLYVRDESRD